MDGFTYGYRSLEEGQVAESDCDEWVWCQSLPVPVVSSSAGVAM